MGGCLIGGEWRRKNVFYGFFKGEMLIYRAGVGGVGF